MRLAIVLFLLAEGLGLAQTQPTQFAGIGTSWSEYTGFTESLYYARKLVGTERPMYSYTAANITGYTTHPFRLKTSVETGIAQLLGTFGPFSVYGAGTFGSSPIMTQDGGTATGYAITGRAIAYASLSKGWRIGPYFSVSQPSLADRQWGIGVTLGWGE